MIVATTAGPYSLKQERDQATKACKALGMEVFVLETQTPYILRTNDISKVTVKMIGLF